ncbi:nuclear receptor coactivator 3 isoform X3 [Diorhabda sublineata]|uniref:nuclear receptor coactivator 3 isoform X3 n=1 Tax=Diorhabda sublineata TaxID=1163346 RepID=UPI0024E0CB0E|nr:nuclear receptor coactivator 3 isoform X3 [Diorhabda sublineata]
MLEHSAMYLNVTPPYEEDTSFFPDFYTTRLGSCELQDPVWGKMSSLTAGVNKKRKKSETKPQAQINKCNNEKRRREQENIYIEELAELISANFADMSSLSVKPDKCAILQEAVNQIRSIKQQENATQSSDPVQQGEVSSSRPTILSNDFYGPLLLEALEGFLFVVNSEGKVEHVTENISNYIKFTRDDVLGKSIYNFIHHGDHTKFHSSLLPVTIEWGNEQQVNNKSKSIDIRLLVKPPDDLNQTIEEKQQRVSSYELMHISSTQLRDHLSVSEEDGSDSGPCLLCVASRISHRDKTTCNIEQFTTKLDTTGKVICVDTSGVTDTLAQYIKKELRNRPLRELVPQQEVNKVTAHLRETISLGQSSSSIYRLQFGPDKVIQVQTKSKLFKTNPHANTDSDFIMATHSVIGENDLTGQSDTTSGTNNLSNTGVGGPLMPSVVNGNRKGPPISSGNENSSNTLLNPNTSFNTFNLDNEFNFDIFPTSSTWELDSTNWQEGRPDSRTSVTPTPRPPSNPSYSNAPTVVQSSPFSSQQSPTIPNPPPPVASNPYAGVGNFFSPMSDQGFSMEEQKDTKVNVLDDAVRTAESTKLRSLLTNPRNENDDKNKDPILKELLNQQDEDNVRSDNRGSPRGLINRGSLPGPSEPPKTPNAPTENIMLRKLLNKTDDDDNESRVGRKKQSELLQQLLKPERDTEDDKKNDIQCNSDLMRSLGFPSSPTDTSKKRAIEDKDENPAKKPAEVSQVSSSGSLSGNSLRERNKMLASLLEKDSSNHQPIPHIPASVISATPQEKLPRISDHNKAVQIVMNQNAMNNSRMGVSRMPGRPSQANSNYLNNLSSNSNMQRNRINLVNSSCFSSPATSTTDNCIWDPNLQASADPLLSELLDQVIDFVPDVGIMLLDGGDGQQNNNFALSEAVAINNIQKSLMQCESVVTSPGSPVSLSGNPPAYSSSNLSSQNNAVFSPPPSYPQQRRVQIRSSNAGSQQCPTNVNNQSLMHRTLFLEQQQQKRRLLLQQKQQHLLISSNAASNEISSNINSIQNIDSLLNNTVAPNVSLQRSSSVPSESQLSPPYGQTSRVNNQQPYSPHSQLTSPAFPQTTSVTNYQNSPAGLSPQSQFNAQLSPRQAYPQASTQNTSWQQAQSRMSVQQNPMLSAQLTRPPQQSQRSINSPGSVGARHSPYPTGDQFPTPNSPNSAFNNPYLRLQRANSVPSATSQLPGGLGSPRPYTGRDHHSHLYPPVPPHPHSVPQMMSYQQDSQYCYDQTGIPLAYNGADRGRAPPHLQPGVSGSAPTSEFVRQELRAVVGARTAQAQPAAGTTAPPTRPPSQMQLTQQQQVSDLETLGLNFEMATGASDSPKLWGAMGTDMGSMSPQPVNSRNTMEEARQGDSKSSLLQKLLSE